MDEIPLDFGLGTRVRSGPFRFWGSEVHSVDNGECSREIILGRLKTVRCSGLGIDRNTLKRNLYLAGTPWTLTNVHLIQVLIS